MGEVKNDIGRGMGNAREVGVNKLKVGGKFHDADLWILGAPPDRFDQYCRQVRDEYAWVPDADYAAGRAAVLMPFAASDRLYLTPSASRWPSGRVSRASARSSCSALGLPRVRSNFSPWARTSS